MAESSVKTAVITIPQYKDVQFWSSSLGKRCKKVVCQEVKYDGTNDLLRVTVEAETQNYRMFVKSAKKSDPDYNYAPEQLRFFIAQELYFYKLVAPFLSDMISDVLPIPRFYAGCKKDGWIAVEDLSLRGYKVPTPLHFNKFKLSQIPPMLASLAQFHANCKACDQGWQNKFPQLTTSIDTFLNLWWEKVPKALQLIRKALATLKVGDHLAMSLMKDWKESDLNRARTWFKSNIDRFDTLSELKLEYFARVKSDSIWNVVCSNDYWNENVMYNLDADPKCMMIDWELMHFGSAAFDVLNCLVDSLNQDVWSSNMQTLLTQYHDHLVVRLRELSKTRKIAPQFYSSSLFKLEVRRMILPLFLRQSAWQVAYSTEDMAVEYSLTLCNSLAKCFDL